MAYKPKVLAVPDGGTGANTLTGVLVGNGTSAVTASTVTQYDVLVGGASNTISNVGTGSAGQVLQSAGNAANPAYSTPTYPSASGTSRKILVSDGTNNVYSTETYAVPGTSGNVLTSNGTNWTSAAPATSGTVTSVSGTTNQVSVATGTTTPVISLVGPYTPATYTAHGVLIGETTSSIVATAAGSAGQHLQSGGASADPTWTTATFPATATSTGTILRADGTNWAATTSTYPNTNAVSTLLYASSANVMGALATANSGVLTTDASGVPSIDTTNFVRQTTGMQMKGNNTNTAPPAGFIGEQIRSAIASGSPVSLTTNTGANITSISLTAGIWDISCNVKFIAAATTSCTLLQWGISPTSATVDVFGDDFGSQSYTTAVVGQSLFFTIPSYRVMLAGTTTYYLVAVSTFTISTMTAYGRISATRVG